jgi:hypothetical protein
VLNTYSWRAGPRGSEILRPRMSGCSGHTRARQPNRSLPISRQGNAKRASASHRVSRISSVFLCGVDHRQDTRCCAIIEHRCFREVRCVRVGQLAKAYVRVHALGCGLRAIGGRRSWLYFAIAFPSDGEGMANASGSGSERGYADQEIELNGLPQPTRGLRNALTCR